MLSKERVHSTLTILNFFYVVQTKTELLCMWRFSFPTLPTGAGPTLCQRCVACCLSTSGVGLKISVTITFRMSNTNLLEHRTSANMSSCKKETPYIVNMLHTDPRNTQGHNVKS